MSTDLTVRPDGAIYDLIPKPHIAATVAVLRMLLSDATVLSPTISRLPITAERQRLNERRNDLISLLAPARNSTAARERVGKAIGMMLGGWLNARGVNVQETIAGWALKLEELPGWAVQLACEDFKEGRATFEEAGKLQRLSPEYAPSQATVWRVAREKISDLIAERDLIEKILGARLAAPEVSEVESGRVGAMMAQLAGNMGAKVRESKAKDAEAARKAGAEAAERRARFKVDADKRRMARYAVLGLRPIYSGDNLCDADALPNEYRFSVHEPVPQEAKHLLVSS